MAKESKPEFFLDDILGELFKKPKPKRKADPDYGEFRRLCKKNDLTYTVSDDGYVDIEAPDGTRFAIGDNWAGRVNRLESILETGYDPGHGDHFLISWPGKAENKVLPMKPCLPRLLNDQ